MAGTRVIVVGPPDTSGVQTGALWRTSTGNVVLVMTPITERVFNIAFWPEEGWDGTIPGEGAQASMIAAEVLAIDGEHVSSALPGLVELITDVTDEAHADALRKYEERQR